MQNVFFLSLFSQIVIIFTSLLKRIYGLYTPLNYSYLVRRHSLFIKKKYFAWKYENS